MTDIRGPDKEIVKLEYETGKYTFKQLAEKFNISEGTIKSWAKRDKDNSQPWLKNKSSKVATKTKKVATENIDKNNINKEPKLEAVIELENSELTDKQRLFCIYYVKYFNATKAATKAGYSKDTSAEQGSRLLSNVKIQEEVIRLKASKFRGAFLDKEDLLQKYIDIAFADITDYLEFGQEEVPIMGAFGPVIDKETKEIITKMINVVKFKQSVEVDGTIISEVKQGKDGASIKLQDKMKALDFLAKHIGLLDVSTKEKIENEKAKVAMVREKLELEKSKVMGTDEEVGDDGFLEALKGEIAEVWDNE